MFHRVAFAFVGNAKTSSRRPSSIVAIVAPPVVGAQGRPPVALATRWISTPLASVYGVIDADATTAIVAIVAARSLRASSPSTGPLLPDAEILQEDHDDRPVFVAK